MDRSRPLTRRPLIALVTAAALAVPGLTVISSAARAADAELARNGGFESGLDGWTCTGGAVVTTPVRSGTSALKATPAGADNARCSQTVSVKPDSQYTLSGWVRGDYVYLGAAGTGTTDVSTWSPAAGDWKQITTGFRTGPATTKVTLFTHGWYGTGAYYADDISLTGPGGEI
ncbi:carbohydrate binding domain-containing protein, partial [Streptomyces sp. SHP 1-2]|uniref:carbohydrate binding domain-containing protein n=1 Tax=Streptomyces sp. SHP 1-2 TaxID=2769489 RepID=UPI0022389A7A